MPFLHTCPVIRKMWADNMVCDTSGILNCDACGSVHDIVDEGEISWAAAVRLGLVLSAPVSEVRAAVIVTASTEELKKELSYRSDWCPALASDDMPPEVEVS